MKIFKIIFVLSLFSSYIYAKADLNSSKDAKTNKSDIKKEKVVIKSNFNNHDILLFKIENGDKKITPKSIEEALKKGGFTVLVNRDMNGPFKKQFQKSSFDIYNLMTLYDKKLAVQIVKKFPNGGIFAPFSMGIWQKKGDKNLYISFPSAKVMAKILGKDDKLFHQLETKMINSLKTALPQIKASKLPYSPKSTNDKLISEFSTQVSDDEADDSKDEIEMVYENGLKPIGFIKAGSNPFDVDLDDAKNEDFEFYDCFSMCKLKVIYTISKKHPEAGAFAPCTLVIYHKKGSGKTTIAFPNVNNWFSSLNLSDKEEIDVLKKAQEDIVKLIKSAIE